MSLCDRRDAEITEKLSRAGYARLPESSYGPHVVYVMVRVSGRKSPVRVSVTRESWAAVRAARVVSHV